MRGFSITFETVTPESAEHGDVEARGFIAQDLTFRKALELFNSERGGNGVEADCFPVTAPRWFTDYGEQDSTGEQRSVSLHMPKNITPATRRRIGRLVNCYGLKDGKRA